MSSKASKKIALFNKNDEVVRTYPWTSEGVLVVKDNHTHRVVIMTNSVTNKKGLPTHCEILSSVTSLNKPFKIQQFGYLAPLHGDENVTPSVKIPEENQSLYKKVFKWTVLSNSLLILLICLIGYFLKPNSKDLMPKTVVIVQPPKAKMIPPKKKPLVTKVRRRKPIAKRPVLKKVIATKVKRKIVKAKKRRKIVATKALKKRKPIKSAKKYTVNRRKRPTTSNYRGNRLNKNIGVLGTLSKAKHRGGLNIDKLSTSGGPGLGGKRGSGGLQTTLYGKGLKKMALGPGKNIRGKGGYGRVGAGGGKAGSGSLSLSGGISGSMYPLTTQAKIHGGLTMSQVESVINRSAGLITYCYEKGLQKTSNLKGRVSTKFSINPQGRVSIAKIKNSSLASRSVNTCIINVIKKLKFPKPVGGVQVNVQYPFTLQRNT